MVLLGGSIAVGVILGLFVGMSQAAIVALIVVGSMIFGAMALWRHANARATGDEWWQDDHCSGWRRYDLS